MHDTSTWRLAPIAVLALLLGCELVAPLRPLTDAGSDGSNAVHDTANDGSANDAASNDTASNDTASNDTASNDTASNDASDAASDGSTGDTAPDGGDTGNPAVTCDPSMRFGEPILVPGLNRDPGNEYRVSFSPDELTAYVSSGDPWWVADILAAKRTISTEPFGPGLKLAGVNGPYGELGVSLTGDGRTIFLDSNRSGTSRIYAATRATVGEAFPSLTEVVLDGADSEADPYVVPDGSALYFISLFYNPERWTLRRAPLDGTAIGTPTTVPVNIAVPRWPVVSADELVLYVYADDVANRGHGSIWMATRTSRELPWGEPQILSELVTPNVEFPQWISPDACRLYFGRETPNGIFLFVTERVRN